MTLIPPEAGILMRTQLDTTLQPATPVQGLSSDLPDLLPGQVFSARIQDVLPENTYRALVSGKLITLSLPEGAKAGDTLELVVIDRSPKVIIAQSASAAQVAELGDTAKNTTLSPAAQMIGKLLVADGETPQPALLNRGQALLDAPPDTNAAPLAAALGKAVANSGLFYEAHQAQWLAGQKSLADLQQEPQAQQAPVSNARADIDETAVKTAARPANELASRAAATTSQAETNNPPTQRESAASSASGLSSTQHAVPETLRPLVQQQLETAANNRMLWHGEAWPGQPLELEVEREGGRETQSDEAEPAQWRTTLRLSMPRLGSVDASLQLNGKRLRLTLNSASAASAADLQQALPSLGQALGDAGLSLLDAQVRHDAE